MDTSAAKRIKAYLERMYDIPFDVNASTHFQDSHFEIRPHNDEKELFIVEAKFKNQLRLTIEVTPEKYAAFSIKDMETSPLEKKKMFSEYARQLIEKRAKVDFLIDNNAMDLSVPESWPQTWNQYKLRVSKSPICAED